MNKAVFGKTMGNVRKHGDIKLVTTEKKKALFSIRTKPSYNKILFLKFIGGRNEKEKKKKAHTNIHEWTCLFWISILESSKSVINEFWYDFVKLKYDGKAKLCYMDTGSFIVYIKTEDIYTYIVKDVETRFETSNYELPITYYIPLPIGKKFKKSIILMKVGLMAEFASLRPKNQSYLTDNNDESKKVKGTKH